MNRNEFTLTENHIKLLKHCYVGWNDCETGAPEINPKRPYGNSYVAGDVHEILTGGNSNRLSEDQEDLYLTLHRETDYALQIILSTGSFTPGHYTRKPYSNKWTMSTV